MTTVSAGSSGSYTLASGDSVVLTVTGSNVAHVSVASSSGAPKYGAAVNGSRTIGPFSSGDVVTITAFRGSVDYSVVGTPVGAAVDSIVAVTNHLQLPMLLYGTVNKANYVRSRSAWAGVRAGTRSMKVVVLGDSTTMGAYATGAANAVAGNRPLSVPSIFAAALGGGDVPVIDAAFFGDQGVTNTGTMDSYDPGRTAGPGAGWISTAGAPNSTTLGGNMVYTPSGSTSYGFRPFTPIDTVDVYYSILSGQSSNWTITRSGDTSVTGLSSTAATPALGKATLTGALGITMTQVQRVSGGLGLYICGMDCYNSAVKSVRVINAGWSSSRTSDWIVTTNPWSPLNMLLALAPDLVIIQPGINEYHLAGDQTGSPSATVGGQLPATFQANLETLVATLLAAGTDVILRTHYPTQNSTHNLTMQASYAAVTRAVAANHGLVCEDVFAAVGSWERAGLSGAASPGYSWMADSLHPIAELYRRSGENLAGLVSALMN